MKMKVKEVADLVGISVRTLHHYDDIGLLKPDETTEAGYRYYSDQNLETLQQILFFRELDFPLKEIKEIITAPSFDRHEALRLQREMLQKKRERIDLMIATIDKTTKHMNGEIDMTNEEKFAGFDFSHNPYEEEARKRWGNKAVDQANTAFTNEALGEKMNDIFRRLAALTDIPPESAEAQTGIAEWYHFLNSSTGNYYSPEAFKGLGELYVADERFTKNIDQFGEGLARFMRDAMAVYADNHKK
ncbi:MerR family transcriptional regulator [Sporosarcina sp. P37]|uniref:MerR family transcriptional regulator n=1 Tax=unclassified Sporosarcina TaxID=2647733 RepID=UPI000A17AE7D|nr:MULTISPECIES: MerR family transcriptional regulator [unclassified Sporosarcina]ARK25174.1 MerR family transcriptional regulator [Sporosarcina sp. P37]PID17509.1 MerR family transcriptional regulator [Sporosarcina sp. P35]